MHDDKRIPPQPTVAAPPPGLVAIRGPSGRLYGMLDPQRMVIEFKTGKEREAICLKDYLPKS